MMLLDRQNANGLCRILSCFHSRLPGKVIVDIDGNFISCKLAVVAVLGNYGLDIQT